MLLLLLLLRISCMLTIRPLCCYSGYSAAHAVSLHCAVTWSKSKETATQRRTETSQGRQTTPARTVHEYFKPFVCRTKSPGPCWVRVETGSWRNPLLWTRSRGRAGPVFTCCLVWPTRRLLRAARRRRRWRSCASGTRPPPSGFSRTSPCSCWGSRSLGSRFSPRLRPGVVLAVYPG